MRGRGGGRGRAAKRPADDCDLTGVGRGKVPRKASNVANEPGSSIPAEVLPRDMGPFNASLMLEYVGKQNHATASLLADFFLTHVEYGSDNIIPGLLAMSQGMNKAVSSYATVCKDFDMANDRFEQSCNQQFAINQMNMELTSENTRLKVCASLFTVVLLALRRLRQAEVLSLQAELVTARKSLNTAAATVSALDDEVVDLKSKLAASKAEAANALSEFSDRQQLFDAEKSELNLRNESLEAGLDDARKHADLYLSAVNKFMDPVEGVQHRCPVIQNNGVIRSLQSLIEIWTNESDMGQGGAFRMFMCPVTRKLSTIAPFPIVGTVMKLASAAAVDVTSPIVFMYKEGLSWIEFSFREQLELIARLCGVYRDRKDASKPPEQWNVSINGGKSVLIIMRAVAHGEKIRLICLGVENDSQKTVEIKVVFDDAWDDPFPDIVFPSGV